MKIKNRILVAMASLIAMMNMILVVSAAESTDITVTVTVSYLSINLSQSNIAFGVVKSGTMVNSSVIVTNDGNWPINLTLKQNCISPTCNWTIGDNISDIDTDKYMMAGKFTNTTQDAPAPDNDDVITSTQKTVAANMGDGDTMRLWLYFNAPTKTTYKTRQSITVTLGVVAV